MGVYSAFTQITDQMLDILLLFHENGKILYANQNAKREFGYEDGFETFSIRDLFPILLQQIDDFREYAANQKDEQIETIAYRKNQTCFPVEIRISPVHGEQTYTEIYLCSVRNLFIQKDLQRKLEKAEVEAKAAEIVRNEFVANVTHELRTPVNGIKGHVRYLMEQTQLSQEQISTMRIIERCCENMEKIINNLLDFSKIEAGKFSLELNEFRFRDCIQHIVDTNIKQANEKGIALEAKIADSIPEVLIGDELRLTQILNNLLSNAVKFTSIGHVRLEIVEAAHIGNEIELFFMVMDTGIGIEPGDKDKLFKSFSQVDGSITRKFGGTGLGLAVTKNLVEMMRGTINVESWPGKGSTFAFSIILNTLDEPCENNAKVIEELKVKPDINRMLLTNNAEEMEEIYQFGSKANCQELKKNMDKLVLCIEMNTWEKAEEFAGNIKKLVQKGEPEYTKQAFKLKMSVRREDYEKSISIYEQLKEMFATL